MYLFAFRKYLLRIILFPNRIESPQLIIIQFITFINISLKVFSWLFRNFVFQSLRYFVYVVLGNSINSCNFLFRLIHANLHKVIVIYFFSLCIRYYYFFISFLAGRRHFIIWTIIYSIHTSYYYAISLCIWSTRNFW